MPFVRDGETCWRHVKEDDTDAILEVEDDNDIVWIEDVHEMCGHVEAEHPAPPGCTFVKSTTWGGVSVRDTPEVTKGATLEQVLAAAQEYGSVSCPVNPGIDPTFSLNGDDDDEDDNYDDDDWDEDDDEEIVQSHKATERDKKHMGSTGYWGDFIFERNYDAKGGGTLRYDPEGVKKLINDWRRYARDQVLFTGLQHNHWLQLARIIWHILQSGRSCRYIILNERDMNSKADRVRACYELLDLVKATRKSYQPLLDDEEFQKWLKPLAKRLACTANHNELHRGRWLASWLWVVTVKLWGIEEVTIQPATKLERLKMEVYQLKYAAKEEAKKKVAFSLVPTWESEGA